MDRQMRRGIFGGVVSGLIVALIGFNVAQSLNFGKNAMTKEQVQEAASLLVEDDDKARVLLQRLEESGKFKGDQGDQGDKGSQGDKGERGPEGSIQQHQIEALLFAVCRSQGIERCCNHVSIPTRKKFPELQKTCPL